MTQDSLMSVYIHSLCASVQILKRQNLIARGIRREVHILFGCQGAVVAALRQKDGLVREVAL